MNFWHFNSILATPDTHIAPLHKRFVLTTCECECRHTKCAWEILPPGSELRIVSSYVSSVKQKRGQREWTGRQKEECERRGGERDQMLGWQHRESHYRQWQQLKITWHKTLPATGGDQESERNRRQSTRDKRACGSQTTWNFKICSLNFEWILTWILCWLFWFDLLCFKCAVLLSTLKNGRQKDQDFMLTLFWFYLLCFVV